MTAALWGLVALLAAGPSQASGLEDAHRLLGQMKAANARIVDLKCTFLFQVTKNGRPFPLHRTVLRWRTEPETIHMTYLEPNKGRTVLYVKGQNDGKMRVRPDGFWRFLTVSLDPAGERAMEKAVDPLTAQGFPNIVKTAEEILARAEKDPAIRVAVEWDVPGRNGLTARLCIVGPEVGELVLLVDQATSLPYQIIKAKGRDGATYTYDDLQLNPGLPEAEFSLSPKH